MECQKITNLLSNIPDKVAKFITKKWIEVDDQSGNGNDRYQQDKQIRFKKSMLQPDLCDYNDVYIVVKGTITVTGASNRDRRKRSSAIKSNVAFISCRSKINNVITDNAEDLDVVMPTYNLIEYSINYRKKNR